MSEGRPQNVNLFLRGPLALRSEKFEISAFYWNPEGLDGEPLLKKGLYSVASGE
jgi:hypothetical protein